MGTCIKTQLNAVIQNDNLPVLNGTIIHNATSKNNFKIASYNEAAVATILGNGYFGTPGVKTYTGDGAAVNFVSNGCNIKITNKDTVYNVVMDSADFADLAYFPSLAYFDVKNAHGDISNLAESPILSLMIASSPTVASQDIYGDMSKLHAGMKKLWLQNTAVTASNIGAFIASIADLPFVETGANVGAYIRLNGNSGITGTLEDIVSACVDANRVNKAIELEIKGTQITFGGSDLVSTMSRYSDLAFLKWTDKTHLYYQMGSDDEVADTTKNVHIFAKGATAEQITTWQSQGNTVHEVS